jgi:ClpA/ClpB-like protein
MGQQAPVDYIGTEHLLLGLLREGEGVAAQVPNDGIPSGTADLGRGSHVQHLKGPACGMRRLHPVQRPREPANPGKNTQHQTVP